MSLLRALPSIAAVLLVAGFARAQSPPPDAMQPETAKDDQKMTPETARDNDKLQPETATDAPRKPPTRQGQRAAEIAKEGVRSNTPPKPPPPKQPKPQS